jgi:MFS family permease
MSGRLTRKDLSILIGNSLDHFDTSLYGFLAPLLAPLFFPKYEPTIQLILAYSILATSLFTRPIGAFIFGLIARTLGPIKGLAYSLIGVSITTVIIGLLPTYALAGWLAPFSLIFVRIIQGIFAGGEVTISKLYIMEDKSHIGAFRASYLYQTSSMFGIIFASLASWIVITCNYSAAWRICFCLGGCTGFFGYFLRRYQVNGCTTKQNEVLISHITPGIDAIWNNKLNILSITVTTVFSHMTYAIPFIVMNSFIPMITSIKLETMMALNTSLLAVDMITIPILGRLGLKYDPIKIMVSSCAILALTIIPLWQGLNNASLFYVTFVRFWFIICGVLFLCPLNLWYKNLLNSHDQYLIIGIGNSLVAAIGHLTPTLCLSLWHITGTSLSISLYIITITLVTIYVLKTAKPN